MFLPSQQYGQGRIYHDIDSNDATVICVKCNLQETSHNAYIYVRVTKEIYGLPQAVQIAYDALVKHLDPYG